ncbi:Cilia- and flagella-associated protein 58 [Dissostichus eleginoides]|uniref:Cilia- and flagella-associated protein 58 n=1 Tax=Dissostichus eleginoides TaxID=100907 RepID=A0AAD9FH37_DISEL|nr:Cilia- and flagella-associated protein 58 [Dissostichus eleginoides]
MREEMDKSKVEIRLLKGVIASGKKVSDENAVFFKGKYLEYKNKFGLEKSLRQVKEKEAEHFGNQSKENRRLNMLVEKLSHDVEELTGHKNFSIKKIEDLGEVIRKKNKEVAAREKDAKESSESALKYKLNCQILKPYPGKVKVLIKEFERLSEELKKQSRQDDVNNRTIHDFKKRNEHMEHKIVGWENKYANLEVDNEILLEKIRVLIKAAETHDEKVLEEQNLRKHMEVEVKKKRDVDIKLQNQESKTKHETNALFQDLIKLRAFIVELEKMLTQTKTHADGVEAERNLLLQKQREDKAQLSELKEIIDQKDKKLQDKTCEAKVQKVQMARLRMENRCLRKQVWKGRQDQAESKKKQDVCVVSADRNQMLVEKKLAKMAAEKETLEKELQTRDNIEVQQQLKINQATLTIKEHELQKRQMCLEIKMLKIKCNVQVPGKSEHTSRREWTREKKKSPHAYVKVMKAQHRLYLLTGKPQNVRLLEQKNEEIEELRRMLARRPDDAIQKMQLFGWENRRLSKELMAAKGSLGMYQPGYENLKEENERLKKTLKMDHLKTKEKLRKSESGDMNQLTPLPPISQNPRSPAEETARDQGFSGYKPRPNRVLIKSECLQKS